MRIPTLAALLFVPLLLSASANAQTELLELIPADNEAYDFFGSAVALRADFAIVGAEWKDVGQKQDAGKAYVFDANTGQELLQLVASPTGADDSARRRSRDPPTEPARSAGGGFQDSGANVRPLSIPGRASPGRQA